MYPHTSRNVRSVTHTTNAEYGEFFVQKSQKINIQPELLRILRYMDANKLELKRNLSEFVQYNSCITQYRSRKTVMKMIRFMVEYWLRKLSIQYECFEYGEYDVEGFRFRKPPIILAYTKPHPRKKTILVYSYLDIAYADMEKWKTDPFTVVERNDRLYGAGTASGKGPLLCWLHVIEAFQVCEMELPVNIKFIIESMNHLDSVGLTEFLESKKLKMFNDIDYIVATDSEWLGYKQPCLIFGSVGTVHFNLTIEKNPESQTEIKDDMENIFKEICDEKKTILIPDFNEYVAQITPDEEKLYQGITDFEIDDLLFRDSLPPHMLDWTKEKLLMHFWRQPSIWVGPTESCECDKQDFSKIKKHFILKIVPNQIIDKVREITDQHVKNSVEKLGIENKVETKVTSATRPWLEKYDNPNYTAAKRAIRQIYKEDPNMIREDKRRLCVTILEKVFEKNILLMPLGNKGSNIDEENENISVRNFYEGTKVIAAYLLQLASLN